MVSSLLPGLGVEHVNVVAAGDVQAVGGGVDNQIIPPAGVGQLPVVEDVVGLLRCAGCRPGAADGNKKAAEEGRGKKSRGHMGEGCAGFAWKSPLE